MNKKNKYGQYFTIDSIAHFMVGLITHDHESRILEPSCGEGVFLTHLKLHGFNNLAAYEIDDDLAHGFGFVRHESFVSSPLDERFSVIIGNPPYIRWKNLEPELKEELGKSALWKKYFNSLCDYLFIFILKSIEQLENEGELIFICTEYWMNTTHSEALRNYMVEHGYFSEIYHFKEAPLFEGVTASFVIFRYIKSSKKNKKDIVLYQYIRKGRPKVEELEDKTCFDRVEIPQFRQHERWLLATKEVQDELLLFESSCSVKNGLFDKSLNRIKDYCDIGNGMVSGLDAAFSLDKDEKLNEEEEKYTIKVIKAKNLEQYSFNDYIKYIFIPEQDKIENFEKDFPHFYKHLEPYVEKLGKRYSYNRDIPYWSFVFPRNQKLFERNEEKIFIPCKERISKRHYFRFTYVPQGYYPLQDVTGILRKKGCRESLEYILAFLNTKYVFDWLIYNGIIKGAIVEFSEAPIASIPFRAIDWGNSIEVKIHDEITDCTKKYINTKNSEILEKINENFRILIYGTY